MQDRAIAEIGALQLKRMQGLAPVDLYIENMFPGKDWQMLLLIFEIIDNNGVLQCEYKGIDIERVGQENTDYRKYAYRKGSSRGGDVTFTTKLSLPVYKKINNIQIAQFNKVLVKEGVEVEFFRFIKDSFNRNIDIIKEELEDLFKNFDKKQRVTTGISFKFLKNGERKYLHDFEIIKEIILESGSETMYTHTGTESRTRNKICSVTGKEEEDIYGFAAPYKYSSPDKPGFISGFFDKKKNWRNYPISSKETLKLELGRKFIKQNLTGYFYGYEYYIVPHPIIKTDINRLETIIKRLKTAFDIEKQESKEKKRRAEDRIQKIIAEEENYFNLDLLFFKEDKKTQAISILLMLEEILPSRFRTLFIDVPDRINKNLLFKDAITIKKETNDLRFSFRILNLFFDKYFLLIVQKVFLGNTLSINYVFEYIMKLYRKNYNEAKSADKWVEPGIWTVKKAIMLILYLQELEIITYNKNYNFMETEDVAKKGSAFNTEGFNRFIIENKSFLDSNIKIGIFAVGVLVRFLFDIQAANLGGNTPFENKLRGYKLNPDLLKHIYTDALSKIEAYQSFYAYQELRQIINNYFLVNSNKLNELSNSELSFYFVAGLELGKTFKYGKEDNN